MNLHKIMLLLLAIINISYVFIQSKQGEFEMHEIESQEEILEIVLNKDLRKIVFIVAFASGLVGVIIALCQDPLEDANAFHVSSIMLPPELSLLSTLGFISGYCSGMFIQKYYVITTQLFSNTLKMMVAPNKSYIKSK